MDTGHRWGRGSLALGIYLALAIGFFLARLEILAVLAVLAALVSVMDLLLVARRSERASHL